MTVSAGLQSPVVEGSSSSNQSKFLNVFLLFLLFSDATDIKVKMSNINSDDNLWKLIVMKKTLMKARCSFS